MKANLDVNRWYNWDGDGAGRHPGCVNLQLSWLISHCGPEPAGCKQKPDLDKTVMLIQCKTTPKKSNYAINLKLRRRAFTQGGSLPHKPEVTPNDGCGQCAALVKLPVKQHKSNYRQKEQQCGAPAAMTHSYVLKFKIKDGGGGRVQTTEFYWLSSFSRTGAVASRLPLKATLNCKLPQTFWWKKFWTNLGTTATNRLTKKNRTLQKKKKPDPLGCNYTSLLCSTSQSTV